jgi:beta-glucosidase
MSAFFGLWSVAGPATIAGSPAAAASCPWVGSSAPVPQLVEEVMAQMTEAQELELVEGGSGSYAGNLPAIPALCIPAINMQDGPQGAADGLTGVTQFPAPVAASASWDTSLEQQYGAAVGAEEAGKGANVNLGPTINIVRDPRWGRAYETFGEDPYLNGQMAAAYVDGVQSQGIMAQVKHFAVYNNETNRNSSSDDDVITQRTEQEIYMPAFQAAVNAGVGSIMCAYSYPNGVAACQNSYLLQSLDNEFGFQGFVTSDWGATHSTVAAAEAGEDVDMPGSDGYFGSALESAIPSQLPMAYLDGMVERVLTSLFTSGVFNRTPSGSTGATVTTAAHLATSTQVDEEGTVLLKNSGNILPLNASTVGSIAVIGADASSSVVYSGGGSAAVNASGTPVTPLAGIQAAVGSGVTVTYNNASSQSSAVSAAEAAKVAIIFCDYTESEGSDLSSIDLGTSDDDLIEAVGAAQPNTIVVLNTGSAVTMPWLSDAAGVLEAWYPGQVDGTAIAALLFGTADPSGHLPVTFPTSLSQVPASTAAEFPGANGQVDYNEGIDVGYRWYQSKGLTPLYPFGFGLSYTTFSFSNLSITGFNSANVATVGATVTNTGSRAGADVAQLYIGDPSSTGEPLWQLKDFDRVSLNAGASTTVSFSVPVHDLTYWGGANQNSESATWSGTDGGGWEAPAGSYAIGVGDSSASLPLSGSLTLANPVGPDTVTVTNPGSQSTPAGATVDLPIAATDSASGQTLTYTATALPGGLSINPSTGVITGTALHTGTDTVSVTATDNEAWEGSASFTWTVTTGGTTTTTGATTTTTTGVTTTTAPGTVNCSASTSGATQLNESAYTASVSDIPAATGVQTPIAQAVSHTDSSRFTSGADSAAGMTYEVNMGSAQNFNEIDMYVPDYAGDYPRAYNVEVSANGTSWATVASCTATGQPDIVSFPAQTDQYVEVVLTAGSTTTWWSMEQFLVYSNGSSGTTTTTAASTTTTKATTTTTGATTTTTKPTTTTTAPTTTTTAGSVNCSASTSGQTQVNESAYTASVSDMSGATGVQTPITQAVSHTDSSRFTSGAESAAGMTYEVNMGSAQTVDEIDMYVPDYAGDYPRGYNVEVSANGSSWTTVATCTATAQPTIVSFPAHTDQYLEVVLTAGSTGSWWSMEQFLMYT